MQFKITIKQHDHAALMGVTGIPDAFVEEPPDGEFRHLQTDSVDLFDAWCMKLRAERRWFRANK